MCDFLICFFFLGWYGFLDWKSTRLKSSHLGISYAVFCFIKNDKSFIDSIKTALTGTRLPSRPFGVACEGPGGGPRAPGCAVIVSLFVAVAFYFVSSPPPPPHPPPNPRRARDR